MSDYKHEWTLDLPKLVAAPYRGRNLSVRLERCNSSWRAVLVDLGEFRGTGSTECMAVDDLIDELEQVAAEVKRASGFGAIAENNRRSP